MQIICCNSSQKVHCQDWRTHLILQSSEPLSIDPPKELYKLLSLQGLQKSSAVKLLKTSSLSTNGINYFFQSQNFFLTTQKLFWGCTYKTSEETKNLKLSFRNLHCALRLIIGFEFLPSNLSLTLSYTISFYSIRKSELVLDTQYT